MQSLSGNYYYIYGAKKICAASFYVFTFLSTRICALKSKKKKKKGENKVSFYSLFLWNSVI